VKYSSDKMTDEEAIERAQKEARETSWTGSDFLPPSFQVPISICVAKVGKDFGLQSFQCLGAPEFQTRKMVAEFWKGLNHYIQARQRVKLVSFNGRGFDFPLMELAAFRYGLASPSYYDSTRKRFDSNAIDLMDWFNNFGAIPSWDNVRIAVSPHLPEHAGQTLGDIARRRGIDPLDAVCDYVIADRGHTRILVRSMTDRSQFILITHIKRTMQMVDVLYGVTMQESGVSRLVSVKLNEAAERTRPATIAPPAEETAAVA
jgi:hypothetical protein